MKQLKGLHNQAGFLGKIFSGIGKILKPVGSAFSSVSTALGTPIGQVIGTLGSAGLSYLGGQQANEANLQAAQNVGQFNLEAARETNEFNAEQGEITRQFNAEEAEKQRQWEETMSNTAHQRQMDDMIRAGINPILSGRYGGANAGGGATAHASNVSGVAATMPMYNQQDVITPAINTGLRAKEVEAGVTKIAAEVKQLGAQYGLTNQETARVVAEIDKIKELTEEIKWRGDALKVEAEIKQVTQDIVTRLRYNEALLALDINLLDQRLYAGDYGQSVRNLENISKGSSAIGLMGGAIMGSVLASGGLAGAILNKFVGNKAILKKVEQYAAGLSKSQQKAFWKQVDQFRSTKIINEVFK